MATVMFADLLYQESLSGYETLHDHLYKKALECEKSGIRGADWYCDTYSTMGSDYKLLKDNEFQTLLTKIYSRVVVFARDFGIDRMNVECTSAWLNLAHPGGFQEYHIHPDSHFSIVYYVKTPEDCGDTIFQSDKYYSNMFSLPTDTITYANAVTFKRPAKAGDLLIFRSNISHMVGKNNSKEDRVSISANFCFGD